MNAAQMQSEATSSSEPILDQLVAGVALLDERLHFARVNPAFCELFDLGASRLRGAAVHVLGPASEVLLPLADRVRADRNAVALRGQQLSTGSGRTLQADIIASPAMNGGILFEVYRSPPEMPPPQSRLSESLRGLAHEVKNPLAGVRGAAQLLMRRIADPDLQRLAALIIAEADRLGALTDRLLHPSGKPHLSAVNLHEIAERARALIAAEATPELKLDRDYDPSLPVFRGDVDRLLQLLLNLMRNCVQAGASRIQVRTRADHAAVIDGQPVRLALRVDVLDDGAGVPEALRDTLFLPLVSGRAKGTGLGLALAQEIAHEHGGQIVYNSRTGQTIFSLLLPLALNVDQVNMEPARG